MAPKPHDAYFRGVFGQVDQARGLYRCALPAEPVAAIDWDSLAPVSPDFVDARLADHRADLLYTAALVRIRDVRLYLLPEHKSRRSRDTHVQVERYTGLIFERHQQFDPGTIAAVIPLVVQHGRPWRARRRPGRCRRDCQD
jgi:hypothetical protein